MVITSSPRRCLREPIPEIEHAARLLDQAVTAHMAGDTKSAEKLVQEANIPAIREWTESLWGANSPYAPSRKRLGAAPPGTSAATKDAQRMPPLDVRRK